jgi:hypothetical protein
MLALMIGTMVLLALSMAINLQLKFTDSGRTDVEEAQLARAILRQVADDLRSSVFPAPIDVEGASDAFKAAAEAAKKASAVSGGQQQSGSGSGSDGSGQGGASGQGGSSQGGASSGQSSGGQTPQTGGMGDGATQGTGGQTGAAGATGGSSIGGGAAGGLTGGSTGSGASGATGGTSGTGTGTETDSTTTTLVTGLYGSAYQIQFDIARVPRTDEWNAMPAGAAAGLAAVSQPGLDRTSEVKTVAYMLLTGSPLAGGQPIGPSGLAQPTTGLVRTEMDRATAAYAQTGATLSLSTGKQELLAPEVTSLMFRYFDGTTWYTDWDSTVRQGLPVAVEIQLGVQSSKARTGSVEQAPAAAVAGATPAVNSLLYRLVVQIPAARSGTNTQLQMQDDEAEASASGSSGTGTGAAGSGTSGGSSTLGSGT